MTRIVTRYLFFFIGFVILIQCSTDSINKLKVIPMTEKQVTFSPKTHALDNNDNFSPDDKFLCYDTRRTVFNSDLANSKSIEKVEIETGNETILWEPPYVTGENAAPGIAAVSYHPSENKVIFIHGPLLDELEDRGYYNIRNRTGVEVDGEGKQITNTVDMRDVQNEITTPGAQRGGTHRHEYTRSGNRIGFTYDDFLVLDYDRTIGFMQADKNTPAGYTHYFALILKPAKKNTSIPGEIEKAYGDSWVDESGTMRAFIAKVRAENGIDYQYDLFVADIPLNIDLSTSDAGASSLYPSPPNGISIRRLTTGMKVDGIVRGSFNGQKIAFISEDENGINQVFVINSDGSQKTASQVTELKKNAEAVRWHTSDNWIFFISDGNLFSSFVKEGDSFGKTVQLSNDKLDRAQLVVSRDGNRLAYSIRVTSKDQDGVTVKDVEGLDFLQIFVMDLDWNEISE